MKQAAAVKGATDVATLHAALAPVIDTEATPDLVPLEAMMLEPSEERRRSGSHYTPRTLTEPIVRTTLQPILEALRLDGEPPTPEALLDLKVCDPAMGSAAFLVEVCRQLGDELVAAWDAHGDRPEIPSDEDDLTYARRLIAQRCLYGVDRNPVAVDLSKMSLWLATLAKEHPLTFLDHSLRHGDALVGLDRRQIERFDWKPGGSTFASIRIADHLQTAAELREQIRNASDDVSDWELRDLWRQADEELAQVRLYGDLAIAAFFEGDKAKTREAKRLVFADAITKGTACELYGGLLDLREQDKPLVPFHYQIEFPEVFDRERPGFDAIVGNPPFAGKNTLSEGSIEHYPDWLKESHKESHGNADLVAHFFRRAFDLLRGDGALGLIATNTIGQGDTRATGLRWICTHGGEIYAARKRVKWPGRSASVIVSVVHIMRGHSLGRRSLDAREVPTITAYLFHAGGHEDPIRLHANDGKSFQGSIVLGMGFTFDDTDTKGIANSLAEMRRLEASNLANEEVIVPFIGYSEVASRPTHAHHRYVINFGDRSEYECRARWPELMALVEERVRPSRMKKTKTAVDKQRAARWWQFGSQAKELYRAIAGLDRVLVTASQAMTQYALAFLPAGIVYSSNLTVFPLVSYAAFATLQSQVHEIWVRFHMSSLKDDLAYTPTSCFETFPFSREWDTEQSLEIVGDDYYNYRKRLMVESEEGLTDSYNRFHDPEEQDPGILRLRELHADMDRAVLHAYGWDDVPTDCEFVEDYEGAKPRYRWPNEVQDDVLARLIKLNGERAAEEQRSGAAAAKGRARKKSNGTEAMF